MLGWLLRWRKSICFCLVFMAWHGGGCVYAAACKYAARRCDDAARVARAYGDCVRRIFGDCSRQLHIRLLLAVLPFAAAVAVLGVVTLSLQGMIDFRGACDLF